MMCAVYIVIGMVIGMCVIIALAAVVAGADADRRKP